MPSLTYAKAEVLSLKSHPDYQERWVRDRIVEDPSLLGLGPLTVKDVERAQASSQRAGRMDLLLADPIGRRWYEVELMLGAVDESHVIRTLEYWDSERKRFPQFDHCAVLVAEDVSPRFLNVLSLFNTAIPVIALRMVALRVHQYVVLQFQRALDEVRRGPTVSPQPAIPLAAALPAEDFLQREARSWEQRGPNLGPMILVECLSLLGEIRPGITPDYRKDSVGLHVAGRSIECLTFYPHWDFVGVKAAVPQKQEWLEKLEKAGFVVLPGGPTRKRAHFRLTLELARTQRDLLRELFAACLRADGPAPDPATMV
jgi:hypothetical protein